MGDPSRGPHLLHVTLISLYDLHTAPPEWLPATIAALDSFAAAPFPLAFDRIENRKAVTLRTREPLAEARAFQKALVNHLLAKKRRRSWTAPPPNRTSPKTLSANYRGGRQNAQKMPPIGWMVDEIILMESVVGKTTHVEHGAGRSAVAAPDRRNEGARCCLIKTVSVPFRFLERAGIVFHKILVSLKTPSCVQGALKTGPGRGTRTVPSSPIGQWPCGELSRLHRSSSSRT